MFRVLALTLPSPTSVAVTLIGHPLGSLIVLVTMDTKQSNEMLVTKLVIGMTSNWNVCLFRNTASSQDHNETSVSY